MKPTLLLSLIGVLFVSACESQKLAFKDDAVGEHNYSTTVTNLDNNKYMVTVVVDDFLPTLRNVYVGLDDEQKMEMDELAQHRIEEVCAEQKKPMPHYSIDYDLTNARAIFSC